MDEVEIAKDLLRGEGLNRIAFARVILGKEEVTPKEKESTRDLFNSVLELLKDKHGDSIYKDGHDHFLKEVDIETLQNQIVDLKAKNAELRQKIIDLSGNGQKVAERKQCLYKNGKGTRFYISEVEDKLEEGWKDHPKGS